MELNPVGKLILKERYLKKVDGQMETPAELFRRVAKIVAEAESCYTQTRSTVNQVEEEFYHLMVNLDFLPNSPTLLNAGEANGQLAACFVLPLEYSLEKVFETLKNTAIIHSQGGGTGFSFSNIAPTNWPKSASANEMPAGPVECLKLINHVTEIIRQGGVRPGANMGTISVDHPDIYDFISCKANSIELSNFNISVAITDEFICKLGQNEMFWLKYNGKNHKKILASDLFEQIAENAWLNGEPGVIFIDELNRHNPTPLQKFETTNPCGEQPLLPYEACNLGSINLVNMVTGGKIDWVKLKKTVSLAVRFLDNVIDVNKIPINLVYQKTIKNRKIGLGVMGFANLLQLLSIPYNSQQAVRLAANLMKFIQVEGQRASVELAGKKGSFPGISESIFQNQTRRNATCTTIAPTGTISSIAGVSPGIEPSFAMIYQRHILDQIVLEINPVLLKVIEQNYSSRKSDLIMNHMQKYGEIHHVPFLTAEDKKIFITAPEIEFYWHLKMQAAFQKYCDNAVSKTVNLRENATVEEVKQIFFTAYKLKCKGVAVYRIRSRQKEALIPTRCPVVSENGQTNLFCD